jgi:hypothetical protein
MIKITKKLTIISTLVISLALFIVIALLYYPLLNPNQTFTVDSDKLYLKAEYTITSYNPLYPRVSQILQLNEGGYLINVQDYQRTGLFTFTPTGTVNNQQKPIDFGQFNAKIENKTLEEVKKITQTQDLSKTPYQEVIPDEAVKKDRELQNLRDLEGKKDPACQKVVSTEKTYTLDDFKSIYRGQDFQLGEDLKGYFGSGLSTGNLKMVFYNTKDKGAQTIQILLEGSIAGDTPAKVLSMRYAFPDCRTEEIPLPDKI